MYDDSTRTLSTGWRVGVMGGGTPITPTLQPLPSDPCINRDCFKVDSRGLQMMNIDVPPNPYSYNPYSYNPYMGGVNRDCFDG
jgi:hypothetical protein